MRPVAFARLALISAVFACGGSSPTPVTPAESPVALSDAGPTEPPPPPTTTTDLPPSEGPGTKLPQARTSEPGRSVEDIRTIILAHRDEARACYDEALKQHPGIEGDVDLKWVIDPKGNATKVEFDEARSTIKDDRVWKCIAQIIQKIKFAESAKGFETKTHYPFNFHPKTFIGGKQDAGAP